MHVKSKLLLPVKYILPLVLLTVYTNTVHAQQPIFNNQEHFGVEEGLPQSYITGIIQDEDGFIWLATQDGLSRYDGRTFKTIHYNPNDTSGLAANTITSLGRLVDNNITIYYSPNQADDFNLRTFRVTRNTIRSQLSRMENIDWQTYHVGFNTTNWYFMMKDHKGAGWLNSVSGEIHYANKANKMLQYDTVCAIVESATGKIYMVNENGVHVSDKHQKKFEWNPFATQVRKQFLNNTGEVFGEKFSIVTLPGNQLAIDDNGKILLIDVDRKSSSIVGLPPPTPGSVSGNGGMQVDTKGRAYFEDHGRIFRLTNDGQVKLLWENHQANQRISAFFIDRSEVLWVSVNAQGLLKIDLEALHFASFRYTTNFIMDIMVQAGVQKALIPKEWASAEASYFFRQAYGKNGSLYACYSFYEPGRMFQLNEKGFHSFNHTPAYALYTAMLDMPGYAVCTFDQVESAWYCWKAPNTDPEKLSLDKNEFKGVEIADAKYLGGYTWLSTYYHGLIQYKGTKQVKRFAGRQPGGILPETLTEICPDPVDSTKFWIGSRGGGLILWDVKNGLQRIYTVNDGLPNNTVYCILPDKSGKIWCSSNKGIFRFDVRSEQATAFEKTDGLSDNEFNRAHKFMFPDGRLAFGGLEGYTIFNPADFAQSNKISSVPILLTGLQVNNQSQDILNPVRIIRESLSTLSSINLPHNRNFLRFEFAAMLFNQPKKTKYRYQMKGVDEEWIETGTNNIASYAALRPGHYTFRINATDNGAWSDTIKEIKVIINPPFWFTWWAYLLYAIMAAALVRWYLIYRENRIKIRQSLAFEKKEALRLKEIDELKDRFFSNITHEFRTPLTLIITPLEKLMDDKSLSAGVFATLQTAQRNSQQLLRLINEFLDFSKLNNGQMKVKLSKGELDLFTAGCVKSFETPANDKKIKVDFHAKDIAGFYLFDKEKWEKIVTNLVGNAIKFTPQHGSISIMLSTTGYDMVRLVVEDSGPGIPEQEQQKIFNRFYQVDDSSVRNYGGTGIGLSLVKELTELLKGTVAVDSKPGGPTRFIVDIPIQKVQMRESIPNVITDKYADVRTIDSPLVLVAEDNDELRSFLVESLQSNYHVIEASDGQKAWELVLQELPDIIISDIMMPGKDGFELCETCKSDDRTAHIGFMLLTSKAAQESRLQGLATGADDYITKPFNLNELHLRIANLLQLQQKQRQYLQSQLAERGPRDVPVQITDPFLAKLYKEMDEKLDDPRLGIDYLCNVMGMSRSTLNRKLKSLLNTSTGDLIRQYRLQKAASLLLSGLDIATTSYTVGFSSPSYFSQCFKEQYGITPTDYVLKRN